MINRDMKILVAEDLAAMRMSVRKILHQLGFENVVVAEDGQAALEIIQTDTIDFVITDINMPKMTGMDLLRAVRAEEKYQKLPVLFITAEAEKSNIIEAVQTGVNEYIIKPFTVAVLDQKIKKIFEA